jgi:hypothetical protein
MKKGKIFPLILLLAVVFQVYLPVLAQNGDVISNSKNEIHITLGPTEKRGAINIPESCLVFLRDFITAIILPLGKQFEWKIPKGTKFEIPAGKYELENKSTSALEIKLLPAEHCREEK